MSAASNAKKISKGQEKAKALRDSCWPDLDDEKLWNRKLVKGFAFLSEKPMVPDRIKAPLEIKNMRLARQRCPTPAWGSFAPNVGHQRVRADLHGSARQSRTIVEDHPKMLGTQWAG